MRIGPGEKVSLEPEWVPQAALVLEWPVAEREGARLHVDGNSVRLPTGPDESDELHVPARPGTRQVWAERRGYAPFHAMVELGRGDRPRMAVEWEPAAGPTEEELVAGTGGEPPTTSESEPEPDPTPQPKREPEPAPSGPTPEELAALQALEAAETQWREATRASAEKAAAWDFTGAAAALAEVRFEDAPSAERLARRKDALTRMAALKERMVVRIKAADPPLTKARRVVQAGDDQVVCLGLGHRTERRNHGKSDGRSRLAPSQQAMVWNGGNRQGRRPRGGGAGGVG